MVGFSRKNLVRFEFILDRPRKPYSSSMINMAFDAPMVIRLNLCYNTNLSLKTRMSTINQKLVYLLFFSFLLDAADGLSVLTVSKEARTNSANTLNSNPAESSKGFVALDPIVYTKLRHDPNNLQIFRKFQLEKTHEEKSKQLKLTESFDDNSTKEISYTYYENTAIGASNITQDDLILEALDRTYKTRVIPVYMHDYDSSKDRDTASDPSLTSASKCKRELDYLIDKLNMIEEFLHRKDGSDLVLAPELAAFFDSFAGQETGILFGNYHWTGNWRQCYKRLVFDMDRGNLSNTIAFRGRYCTANIKSSSWDPKIKHKTAELVDRNYFTSSHQQYDYARFFRIQIGLCLPESCDSTIIDSRSADIFRLATYKLHKPFTNYTLVDLYCLPDETSKLRRIEPGGYLFIVTASLWCLMVLLATYYDCRASSNNKHTSGNKTKRTSSKSSKDQSPDVKQQQQKSTGEKLISALSLIKNYHRLTETESLTTTTTNQAAAVAAKNQPRSTALKASPEEVASGKSSTAGAFLSPNDLLFLNAYKVISMPLIIYGHVGMLSVHLNRFPLDYESFGNDALFHFSSSTVFFVDWYFVTTGFLTSYIMFVTKKVERNKLVDWIYSIFHRYWRLAPLYILLVWFNKYLFQHTSHGPIWDYGTSNMTIRSICRRESWLWPVFLASNWHPIHEECVMPAWYIANDMQFYIITPIILIGLLKWPRATWVTTLGAIVACIMARMHRYLTDPKVQPLELIRPGFDLYMRNNWDVYPTYIYPHYRISSHLIGILAGHYAYKVLRGDWKSSIYSASWFLTKKTPPNNRTDIDNDNRSSIRGRLMGKFMWIFGFQVVVYMAFATWPIKDFFPRSLEPQVKYFTANIYAWSHSTAALGMALMFVSLIFGHFARIRKFLTLPFWTLISRVNFIVYLIQVEVIYWVFQSGERVPDFSGREAFKYWLQLVCLCYSISTILTLWVELPLAHLEREFIGSWMAARSKAQTTSASRSSKPTYLQLKGQRGSQHCEMTTRSESTQLVGESDHHQEASARSVK